MKRSILAAGCGLAGAVAGALLLHLATGRADIPAEPPAEPAASTRDNPAENSGIHMSAQKAQAAGVRWAVLAPATLQAAQHGYARALDPAPLAAIAAEIVTARAALAASRTEAHRLAALAGQDASASRREAEAAAAQANADQARLTAACQRVGLEFGAGLSRLGCGAVPALARAVAAGRGALMRIDMPDGPPAAGTMVNINAMRVRVLGPAASGDGQLQTAGVLALTDRAVSVGPMLPARIITGSGVAAVLVPRTAIMRGDGGLFVYRAGARDGFERVALDGGVPAADGWLVPVGALHGGDRIVIAGADTLLGQEQAGAGGDGNGGA